MIRLPRGNVRSPLSSSTGNNDQRLLNWNFRRAPRWPYFLRSFILLSRVRKPAVRKAGSVVGSYFSSARPIPKTIAPPWPVEPPPVHRAVTSTLPPRIGRLQRSKKMALRSRSLVGSW